MRPLSSGSPIKVLLLCGTLVVTIACDRGSRSGSPISLGESLGEARVTGTPAVQAEVPRLVLGFDETATIAAPDETDENRGWTVLHHASSPRTDDGRLVTRGTGNSAVLAVPIPEGELPVALLGAIAIDLEVSAGSRLGVHFWDEEELDSEFVENFLYYLIDPASPDLVTDLRPGGRHTYELTEADSPSTRPIALGGVRHLGLVVFGADDAEIALGSIRLITRTQRLAEIPAGFGWHGLGEVYRETIVTRSPEVVTWEDVPLGREPWLDLTVGSPEFHAATFRVEVVARGRDPLVAERTVTTRDEWQPIALDLAPLAGRVAEIRFSLSAEDEGRIGFWGSPTVRQRGVPPEVVDPTPAREALADQESPRGVILMIADTLRSDHLDAWGYERPTAPVLARLAAEGVRFDDNVSQAAATKISVPSILTSLYPSTHGVFHLPDRVPSSVTTLTEAFRNAGYATFHTSSTIFSGRNSNLHQGVEVLHERGSIADLGRYRSKTARTYVDRVMRWLESHHEEPFFVLLHVFDPHSPFRPFEPYDRLWLDDESLTAHEAIVGKLVEIDAYRWLPTADDLGRAGLDESAYVAGTVAWYDASIRAMDVEVKRLFEQLEEHGIADDVLFAFVSDHGEEFLEHGRSFHGHSLYGDLINVPMFVRWPGVVPAGRVVEHTTQSIDLMPTLLDLARLPVPAGVQGRSLVPLMATTPDLTSGTVESMPAFSELRGNPAETENTSPDAFAVVYGGWKLIWNVVLRDGRPEHQLFDHRADPLNLRNLASERPDRVAELMQWIERWRAKAEAEAVTGESLEEDLTPDEIEQLRALGYLE